MYYFDDYGWLSEVPISGRVTSIIPPYKRNIPDGYGINYTWYGLIVIPYTPPPTSNQNIMYEIIGSQISNYIDQKAREFGYSDATSIISYINSSNLKYKSEAENFNNFRTLCWEKCEAIQEEVRQGLRNMPTLEQVIKELPDLNTMK